MKQNKINKVRSQIEAINLLHLGFKVSIVASLVNVSSTQLRNYYREIYNCNPKGGQMPSVESLLSTLSVQIQAVILLKLYLKINNKPFKTVDIDALIRSYELYSSIYYDFSNDPPLQWHEINLNDAWIIIMGFITKKVMIKRCSNGCDYLEVYEQNSKLECSFCKLSKIFKKRQKKIITNH